MPLGKNIKKDTLIPDSGKKIKASKAVKRTKVVKKKTTTKSQKVAEKVQEEITQSIEISDEALSLTKKVGPGKFISQGEYEERQRLKGKFDQEIASYKGKQMQLITFPLGKEKYAVDIEAIKEVVPTPTISKIPHAPAYIKGVANIRGVVMVILDLTAKFELGEKKEEETIPQFTMVINGANFNAGMLVTEVPTTLKVNGDDIVSSAGLLSHTALDETFIKGLVKTEEEMVIYLDISELINDDEMKVMTQAINK
ncbi:MAG: purine-binding chemotaxis protein CheW [Reichenbachiella sp.]